MHFGVYLPNYGEFGDPAWLGEMGRLAEDAGWDGFFLWDHVIADWGDEPAPTVDPWVVLAVVAAQTERLLLGPLIVPLARRELSKVAHEAVTLDTLSEGRLVFGAGLGVVNDFRAFGLEQDKRRRGEALSGTLRSLRALWAGRPTGDVLPEAGRSVPLLPRPHGGREIPIWIAGRWPRGESLGPFRRAAEYEGMFPVTREWTPPQGLVQPDDYRELKALLESVGASASIDLVHGGVSAGADADAEALARYAAAGVTWWLESFHPVRGGRKHTEERIAAGPPRAEPHGA